MEFASKIGLHPDLFKEHIENMFTQRCGDEQQSGKKHFEHFWPQFESVLRSLGGEKEEYRLDDLDANNL